jgi:DNA-binding HxlR family transcriptional regulator
MLGKTYDSQVCSIARSLELVGERWSLLIIRDALFAGVTRFSDFQHNLGVATNVLTSRLDAFVASGIMERRGAAEYVLSAKGRSLAVALIALTEWGDEWASPVEPPILYRHTGCGDGVVRHRAARRGGRAHRPRNARRIPGVPPRRLTPRGVGGATGRDGGARVLPTRYAAIRKLDVCRTSVETLAGPPRPIGSTTPPTAWRAP